MMTMRGSERWDAAAGEPLRTESAGGNHAAVVASFLTKYYGTGDGAAIGAPSTLTRHATASAW